MSQIGAIGFVRKEKGVGKEGAANTGGRLNTTAKKRVKLRGKGIDQRPATKSCQRGRRRLSLYDASG